MKKLITAFLIVITLAGCNISNPQNNSFEITVFNKNPSSANYNIFKVIESESYKKPEINIDYNKFINNNPHKESIIEKDTVTLLVEPFISRFDTKRYRLISVIN